jgi:hypothetical protein
MTDAVTLWEENRSLIENKSVAQLISFIGNGNLADESSTSQEFRRLLDVVSSYHLKDYLNHCLQNNFPKSGFALQDIINQIGKRLEYDVEYGLYQGRKNKIGFDGIWKDRVGYALVVEVKTTDAFRINLDDIANYRRALASVERIDLSNSSIIIIVGRGDTGDLEAQIRGSKHAWDIRIISSDSLINLLLLKENLNDARTIRQIHELLKPKEFTRIDSLIEIITQTAEDFAETAESIEYAEEHMESSGKSTHSRTQSASPAAFNAECIEIISRFLRMSLVRSRKVLYHNKEKSTGIVCIVSKQYETAVEQYWYAFHPYQAEFLEEFSNRYVAFGCGTPNNILLIPYSRLSDKLKHLNTTKKKDSFYYHVHIHAKNGRYFLKSNRKNYNKDFDVSEYLLSQTSNDSASFSYTH